MNLIEFCNQGVYLNNPFPSQILSPIIGNTSLPNNNIQNNSFSGVRADGVNNMSPLTIENNLLFNNIYGILAIGETTVDIENNEIESNAVASANFTNGTNDVNLNQNLITSSVYAGLWSYNENPQLSLQSNCFELGGNYDIKIGNGTIANQGNSVTDATNCFSKNGIPEIDGVNITSSFDYFRVLDSTQCYFPAPKNFFNSIDATNYGITLCGLTMIPQPATPDTCVIPDSLSQIVSMIDSLEIEIDSLENNQNLTDDEKARLEIDFKRCLKEAYKKFIVRSLENGDSTSLITKPLSSKYFDIRILGFAQSLLLNDPNTSRQDLTLLNPITQDELDFEFAMNQYIDWLSVKDFTPDPLDLNTLNQIGLRDHLYSGYARSVYFILTGLILNPTLPSFPVYSGPRSIETENLELQIKLYPNPSGDILNIELINNNLRGKGTIRVYDQHGIQVLEFSNLETSISIEQLSAGIYILDLQCENGKSVQSKFVKI